MLNFLNFIDPYIKETEFYDKRVRVWDEVFHHKFKKNVNMKSTGIEKNNRFCTNNFGFKSNCNFTKTNNFEFAFMGDSFTEGIGLNYEKNNHSSAYLLHSIYSFCSTSLSKD